MSIPGRAACAAAVLAAFASGVFGDVTVSVVPERATGDVRAAGTRFDLLVLNEDQERGATYMMPATMPVRVSSPDGVVDAVATRADQAGDQLVSLKTGGFARATYTVSGSRTGRVAIELVDGHAATVVSATVPGMAVNGSSVTSNPLATTTVAAPRNRSRNPFEIVVQQDPNFKSESGLVEYLSYRIKPHEPVYIVAGDEEPTTKFQLSFKYQIFDPNGPVAQKVPALGGLYFGYSQTSLWDLGDDERSNPFFDTSYRPELLVSYDNLDRFLTQGGDRVLPEWLKLGVQAGIKHESNGRGNDDESRSVNIVYIRPIITFSGEQGWFLTLAPSVYGYVFDLDDNPDIADYRGHADLRVVMGQGGGVQLAAIGRMGDGLDHGSLQLDLSFPIRQLTLGNLDVYFHTQYFMGYGESLITYDEADYSLRFGLSLVR